jgi:hypothetical protein
MALQTRVSHRCAWAKSPAAAAALTSRCPAELIRKSATAAAVQHLGRIVRETRAGCEDLGKHGRALIDSGVSKAEDITGATRNLFGNFTLAVEEKTEPFVVIC